MMAHPLSTPLDAAEMFTARGWVVFPCDHPMAGAHCTGTARACRERTCKAERDPMQRGKHPRVRWGEIIAPVDSVALHRWFGRDAIPTNVAIACGPSGLLIVDEDEPGAFAAFCASVGVAVPQTFMVETARGWHYYFTVPVDPQTGERVPVGNAPGQLAAWHCDVRGGASASAERGGYVITAGSEHATRKIYTAPDPYAEAIEAPGWLIEAILSPGPSATAEGVPSRTGTGTGEAAGTLRASDGARWDDAPRYGSAADLLGQFERHCDEVEHEGGAFRHELFLAARDGWRCVALGLLDEPSMLRTLDACVWRVWQAEPDERDHVIVYEEAQPAAAGSPWELTGQTRVLGAHIEPERTFLRSAEAAAVAASEGAVTSEDGTADPPTDGNPSVAPARDSEQDIPPCPPGVDPAAWRTAYRRRTADDAVREYQAAQARPTAVEDDLDAWLDEPDGGYLVEEMLYRDGLAVIFGAPGAAKSFLALDIALSLVTGRPWRDQKLTGRDNGPGVVHYVMAEGRSHNRRRTLAWLAHHGATREDIRGRFFPFPQGVMLTEAGVASYLERVRLHKPDLIILDTKNLMFAGRENAGEDYGRMINVLHMIRRAADEVGCAVVLIDHSGLGDDSRVRGSNAQLGGIDTEIMVEKGDEGLRVAHVTRDKGAPEGAPAEWCFRLAQVDTVEVARGMKAPAVCVPAMRDRPFADDRPWWVHELPEDIPGHEGIRTSPPAVRKCCADLMRLLRSIGDPEGAYTALQLVTMLNEREVPKDRRHKRATAHTAVKVLREAAMIETGTGSTTASPKWMLAEHWAPWKRSG